MSNNELKRLVSAAHEYLSNQLLKNDTLNELDMERYNLTKQWKDFYNGEPLKAWLYHYAILGACVQQEPLKRKRDLAQMVYNYKEVLRINDLIFKIDCDRMDWEEALSFAVWNEIEEFEGEAH